MVRRTWMALATVLALVSLWAPAVAPARAGTLALAPGDPAPRLVGNDLTTMTVHLVDWKDSRLTLVNFWATWCVPCQAEIPALQELDARLRPDGFRVIGVHRHDVPYSDIRDFANMLGGHYWMLVVDPKVTKIWGGLSAMPVSFLIDSKGVILRRYLGSTPETIEGLKADVEAVLAGRRMPPLVIPKEPVDALSLPPGDRPKPPGESPTEPTEPPDEP